MTNLRNQDFRTRDIHKLIQIKLQEVAWDTGFEAGNEWVYASVETKQSKSKLLDWLKSKNINDSNDALWVNLSWSHTKEVTFSQIMHRPESFFGSEPFQIIDMDLTWTLDYLDQEVARFGRWDKTT